ncbi:DoxX family protein [Flavobacterium jejuense]|uniref:DoxX family protein n=1 Tax=Flavobacterium jejuense TaxID=1544455 RepID=A0ABX0IV61_9FLAO|nr:DoxX family protein [Flavobacterium jejuense]NHN27055.1 DoxX family protein [Flavobacterium jejuense]
MKVIKILILILNLYVGGFMIYGSLGKFKPSSKPTEIIEKVQKGEEVAPNEEVLKIKNYIFGMKQSGFFWQFLGIMEFLAGILLVSQVFSRIGAIIALPLTVNIFLFHLFLEGHEIGELIQTFALLIANIILIGSTYKIWKPLLYDKGILKTI